MGLIQEKWDEYFAGLDVGDLRNQFENASCKWRKIADFVNASEHFS
jgi:hypothetical protein